MYNLSDIEKLQPYSEVIDDMITPDDKLIRYHEYLSDHADGIKKGYEFFKDKLPEFITDGFYIQICKHDMSKVSPEELDQYAEYFDEQHPENKDNPRIKMIFKMAWLHHIHNNPHHWEHWILREKDGSEIVFAMPINYVVEMILDWWAFSWKSGNLLDIFDWYEEEKNRMTLNPKTREDVEHILSKLKEVLTGGEL